VPFFRSSRSHRKKALARHEHVVFYPSYGARTADGRGWNLLIQGSVFDSRVSWLRRKPFLAVFRRVLRMDRAAEDHFRTRMRQFLMFGVRGRAMSVRIAGRDHAVGESDYMGLFRGEITLSNDEVARVVAPTQSLPGETRTLTDQTRNAVWVPFQAALAAGDDRSITGRLRLIEPEGVSIISDVDDTIKHSNVPNRRDLFRNTFTRTFVPVEGMPELYRACADSGAAFHFVSGSPWQLYEPLSDFLEAEGYPPGSFHLKRFRIRDSARKLRRSPQKAYKQAAIEPILSAFPGRRFVLIGDSGEQDPEIYGTLLRSNPTQIRGAFIRAVRGEFRDSARLQAAFAGIDPSRWNVYREPTEIHASVAQMLQPNG
jgi:Uncharacterized conserved protein (DUF2183)